jgi:uncharacterized protein involved in response to NO
MNSIAAAESRCASHALRRLADAPHRLFFFLGSANLATAGIWWATLVICRETHWAPAFAAAGLGAHLHPFILLFGTFPLYIFGFLFTAGPRWLNRPAPDRETYIVPGVGMGAAFLLVFPTLPFGDRWTAIPVAAFAACWWMLWSEFSRIVAASTLPDRGHARLIRIFSAVGAAVAAWVAAALAFGLEWRPEVRSIGVWGFLVPLFCTVSHRMIPFFGANHLPASALWRPSWLLRALVAGSCAHGVLEYAGLSHVLWLSDAPLAGVCAYTVVRWGLARSLSNRLLAMLHVSFLWLAIAYFLSAVQSILALAGTAVLGLGALHAITIGFLSSLALAMVTRVTFGHSGRTHAADGVTWGIFLAFQFAALARIAAEVMPAQFHPLLVSALVWSGCICCWVWRHVPIYLAPRSDGLTG